MKRDFLSIADWSHDDHVRILDLSAEVKKNPKKFNTALQGDSIALIFEKQSLRTHVTFEVGVHQLGAHPVYLTQADISLGKRESISDTAKNLERWVGGVVVRTFAHQTCVDLAAAMKVPVVNALTDLEHPCQAVADFLTLREKLGTFRKKRMVYVGDGNNVCHSLFLLAATVGMDFTASTPEGYSPDAKLFDRASAIAKKSGSILTVGHDPLKDIKDADAVYTDVWTSMGQESEREKRLEKFRPFQVNGALMARAGTNALFMHCLPAHRGEEVTDEVIDSPRSIVFDQAENRLHTAKAVLLTLLRKP
jgi:ornithine carbamoyltransferase